MPASRSERWPASFIRAALRVTRRAASILVAMSASLNWIAWCWAIGFAERLALLAVAQGELEGALGDADAAGGDVDAADLQGVHHLHEALADSSLLPAEHPLGWTAVAVVDELG